MRGLGGFGLAPADGLFDFERLINRRRASRCWPDEFRDEVLARLLELNGKRAGEEAHRGRTASTRRGRQYSLTEGYEWRRRSTHWGPRVSGGSPWRSIAGEKRRNIENIGTCRFLLSRTGLAERFSVSDNRHLLANPNARIARGFTMLINVLDPNLSSLAANAAVELDLLIHGEPTTLDDVRQLSERLRRSLTQPELGQPSRRLQVDTETESVLGQAFVRAELGDPGTILSELAQRTEQIASQLSSTEPGTPPRGVEAGQHPLEPQRAFCLALSKAAAAHRQLTFDTRPPHPNRR